ncbi:MAG: CpXC domain-containing protein [Succiniclasticum sp.]|nr:CpXC domain-containing protein [Succiniclasticum sp.]
MEYSETESHFLDCPKCGHHFLHRLKVNFNTETHPEDRQSVRDGSAFQVRCPQCGAAWRVDYSFFYDQPQDQLALYCLLDLKEAASLADAIRRNLLPPEAAPTPVPSWQKYTWRVVRSLADFREKLTIFDAGLDDRYVELFKVFALNQLHVQQPDFQADEIRFARDPEQPAGARWPYRFTIVDNHRGQVAQTPFDESARPLFDQMEAHFGKDMETLFDHEPVIDLQWAQNYIASFQTKN